MNKLEAKKALRNHCKLCIDKGNCKGCDYKLIKEYVKSLEQDLKQDNTHTEDFKHFRLHSEGTLKSLNKNELIEYIYMLHHNWDVTDKQLFNLRKELMDDD